MDYRQYSAELPTSDRLVFLSPEENEVFLSARGDADYMEHSVEIEFDRDQGVAFEADVSTL